MNETGAQGIIHPPGIYWEDNPEFIAAWMAAQKAWADEPVVLRARNAAVKAWADEPVVATRSISTRSIAPRNAAATAFTVGSNAVSEAFLGSTALSSVHVGDVKVWPTAPVFVDAISGELTGLKEVNNVTVSRDGTKVYTGGQVGVGIFDVVSGSPITVVAQNQWQQDMATAPNGKCYTCVTNGVEVISAANAYQSTIAIPGVSYPVAIAVNPSGTKIFVGDAAGIYIVDLATETYIKSVTSYGGLTGCSLTATDTNVYGFMGNMMVVLDHDGNLITRSALPYSTSLIGQIRFNAAGTKLYCGGSEGILVFDLASNAFTKHVQIPQVGGNKATVRGIGVFPDGSKVFASCQYHNAVVVMDAATETITKTITGFNYPYGMAVHPSGTAVYVADGFSGRIAIIG